MSYPATVYKVMIASPGDVIPERNIIREVLVKWNSAHSEKRKIVLLPIAWETHSVPEMGDRPQAIIKKRVQKDCDLLIGVFWTIIGTPTGEYGSGSVEEIEEHIKESKPVMLYFSNSPVRPESVDQAQYSKLIEFKESLIKRERGLVDTYYDLNDFKEKLSQHIQLKMNQDEYFIKDLSDVSENRRELGHSGIPDIPDLSKEAQALLKEASKDNYGNILRYQDSGGFNLQTNGRSFGGQNAREKALWEGALNELESKELIHSEGYKRESFVLTKKGFEVADLIQ
jgi:hypothetical protein